MTRCVAIVILALTLNAAPLHAQESVFTVTVQSADVHKGPTTGSPVVGHAAQGTALTVSRNLGSWAEIVWTDAPDHKGYVHMTMGRLGTPATKAPISSAQAHSLSSPAPAAAYTSGPAMTTTAQRTPGPTGDRVPPPSVPQGGSRISHVLGVGGLLGSMSSFGATGRWWHDKHLGVQATLTHDSMTSDAAAGRVTSMQVEPGVVYALFDRVPDYFWVRPYVGSALSFRHQTWKDTAAPSEPVSDSGVGYRVFGGGELTFASLTQLGVSAELGYRRVPTPFAGFEPDRWTVSIAGHWYIK
jgi:hypothetical protein